MTLKEFKVWLAQFPDDAEVVVIGQQNTQHDFLADIYVDYEYLDFAGNEWVTPTDTQYNKKYLILGVVE